jgi:hypothetical protein
MANTLKTAFWQKAAQSLPAAYRARYLAHFEHAERFELALDGLIEFFSRNSKGLPRRPSGPLASSSSSG